MSILEKASLVITPNGYKAGKLYSVIPNTALGDMDVLRATTATRVNSLGLLENVALNVPRLDYSSGSCPSILVEPQGTNLILKSQEINNFVFDKALTITLEPSTAETLSPFGLSNATKVIANGTGFIHIRQIVYNGTTLPTTNSIFVKKANNRYIGIRNGGAGTLHDVFDFDTETFTNNSTSILSFDKLVNGWYRLKSSRTNTLANSYHSIIIPSNTSGVETATVNNLTVYIFGFQSELNVLNATSYIPTGTSSVTRNADVISKTGISSLIGQTEGTIFLDFKLFPNNPNSAYLFFLSDGTNQNFIRTEITVVNPSVSQFRTGLNTLGVGQGDSFVVISQLINKIAVSYSLNNVKLFINGALVNINTTATIPITNYFFLGNRNATAVIGADYKQAILFKTALTDAECIQLTTL